MKKEERNTENIELPFDTRIQHAVIRDGKIEIIEHLKVLTPNCWICQEDKSIGTQ